MKQDKIKQEFDKYLPQSGKRFFGEFFVGVTNDPERCLFEEHRVARKGHWYMYANADSAADARKVVTYYKRKGMKSSKDSDNTDSKFVYVYPIEQYTVESYGK